MFFDLVYLVADAGGGLDGGGQAGAEGWVSGGQGICVCGDESQRPSEGVAVF